MNKGICKYEGYDPTDMRYAEAGYAYNASQYNLHDKQNPSVYLDGADPAQPYSDMGESYRYDCDAFVLIPDFPRNYRAVRHVAC